MKLFFPTLFFLSSCMLVPANKEIYNFDQNAKIKKNCTKLEKVIYKKNGKLLEPQEVTTVDLKSPDKMLEYYANYFTDLDSKGKECKKVENANLVINLIGESRIWHFALSVVTLGIVPFWQEVKQESSIQPTSIVGSPINNTNIEVSYTYYGAIFLLPIIPFRKFGFVETAEKIDTYQMNELIKNYGGGVDTP